MKKSFAQLLDEYITTNIKIYMLVDKVQKDQHTREDAAKIQSLNLQRSKLGNAINEYMNDVERQIKV